MPKRTPEELANLNHCNKSVLLVAQDLEREGFDLAIIADSLFCALVPLGIATAGHEAFAACLEEWAVRIRSHGGKKLPPEILRLLN